MTLNTYAEVDPDAKLAAVDKIGEGFDFDLDVALAGRPAEPTFTLSFTVEQLEGMLAEARKREGADKPPVSGCPRSPGGKTEPQKPF